MEKTDVSKGKRLLPSWMVHNIERLHTCTDFEQYASSPPETESFIPEHPETMCSEYSGNARQSEIEANYDPAKLNQVSSSAGYKFQHENQVSPSCNLLSRPPSFVDAIKSEDIIYSSPDVTPCVTPEASPMPQRKISLKLQNTVQANPKKWFFIESAISRRYKEIKAMADTGADHNEITVKSIKNISNTKKNKETCDSQSTIKLAISNFDINAVSPSSW